VFVAMTFRFGCRRFLRFADSLVTLALASLCHRFVPRCTQGSLRFGRRALVGGSVLDVVSMASFFVFVEKVRERLGFSARQRRRRTFSLQVALRLHVLDRPEVARIFRHSGVHAIDVDAEDGFQLRFGISQLFSPAERDRVAHALVGFVRFPTRQGVHHVALPFASFLREIPQQAARLADATSSWVSSTAGLRLLSSASFASTHLLASSTSTWHFLAR